MRNNNFITISNNTVANQGIVFTMSVNAITLEPIIFSQIQEIANLDFNWDGQNSIAPNVNTLSHIKSFINNIDKDMLSKIKENDLFATPHGTIGIRIAGKNDNYLNIEFGESYANYYAYIDGEVKFKKEKDTYLSKHISYEIKQAFTELNKA